LCEEETCKQVLLWAKNDSQARNEKLKKMVGNLDFTRISIDFLEETFLREVIVNFAVLFSKIQWLQKMLCFIVFFC